MPSNGELFDLTNLAPKPSFRYLSAVPNRQTQIYSDLERAADDRAIIRDRLTPTFLLARLHGSRKNSKIGVHWN